MTLKGIIANNVKGYRKRLGLSQEALAWQSKLHEDQVGRIERGTEGNPSLETIEKVAEGLKIELYLLFIPNSFEFNITIDRLPFRS